VLTGGVVGVDGDDLTATQSTEEQRVQSVMVSMVFESASWLLIRYMAIMIMVNSLCFRHVTQLPLSLLNAAVGKPMVS
jgi:hypothetical protein